jgi:hypothetical protein
VESEALPRTRTMRQIKSSLDVARKQKARTTNSLYSNNRQNQNTDTAEDKGLSRILEKERRRFAAQEKAVNRSRVQLLKYRERLAKNVNRNRALTDLRLELQRTRFDGNNVTQPKAVETGQGKPKTEQALHRIGLRY